MALFPRGSRLRCCANPVRRPRGKPRCGRCTSARDAGQGVLTPSKSLGTQFHFSFASITEARATCFIEL